MTDRKHKQNQNNERTNKQTNKQTNKATNLTNKALRNWQINKTKQQTI